MGNWCQRHWDCRALWAGAGELFISTTPCIPSHTRHSNDRPRCFEGPGGGSGEGAPLTPHHTHCPPTFALGHRGGAVEVGGGVSRTGDAVVLPEVRLVGAHGAADAAVDAGVVVVPR